MSISVAQTKIIQGLIDRIALLPGAKPFVDEARVKLLKYKDNDWINYESFEFLSHQIKNKIIDLKIDGDLCLDLIKSGKRREDGHWEAFIETDESVLFLSTADTAINALKALHHVVTNKHNLLEVSYVFRNNLCSKDRPRCKRANVNTQRLLTKQVFGRCKKLDGTNNSKNRNSGRPK